MTSVTVVIGAGSIGQAIARRVSSGRHVLLADLRRENAEAAAKVLSEAGFDVSTAAVDISSRASVHALVEAATAIGDVTGIVHAAGVSPSQAPPELILKGRPLRHGSHTGGVRQCHRAGRFLRGHRLHVRPSPPSPDGGSGQASCDHARRRTARAANAPAGQGH